MTTTLDAIKAQQRRWAADRGIRVDDKDYCLSLNDNLLQPLSADSRRDFEAGDGSELGRFGERGKLQALHSSSALACNIFDYWRNQDCAPLAAALNIGHPLTIAFEAKFPTGLAGNPPNLDVAIMHSGHALLAIESKFTEPYGSSSQRNTLKAKYSDKRHWELHGLVGCQNAVDRFGNGSLTFRYLDAAQLLKHMLGLGTRGGAWQLAYIWYDAGDRPAHEHAAEVGRFRQALGDDGNRFRSCSYQELWTTLRPTLDRSHEAYASYLTDRYFT
jgi:hypothetical protein